MIVATDGLPTGTDADDPRPENADAVAPLPRWTISVDATVSARTEAEAIALIDVAIANCAAPGVFRGATISTPGCGSRPRPKLRPPLTTPFLGAPA